MRRLARPATLADRVEAARAHHFVGRKEELALFRAALEDRQPCFAVLHLHGPGGMGKTTLLGEYARMARQARRCVVRVQGRDIDPSPAAFLSALSEGLRAAGHSPAGASALETLATLPPAVLMVDTYEALAPLDAWLRERLLPDLPDRTLLVLAGRDAPTDPWRADPGWHDLFHALPLRNLPPEDTRAYLTARRIPRQMHAAALASTHGHPLALSLTADLLADGRAAVDATLEQAPDLVHALVERFVQSVPQPSERRAIEACAHARFTTEALLRDALPESDDDVHALFEWLRRLSFIEQAPEGLFPHDLAREALDVDLAWRDPATYGELHRRVRAHYVRRLEAAQGLDRQKAALDILYMHRRNPLMRGYYAFRELGSATIEPACPADHRSILAMVDRHEGAAAAHLVEWWLHRQPQAFLAFRARTGGDLIGFVTHLRFDEIPDEARAIDPACRAASEHVAARGPTRAGEQIVIHRFWMDRAGHQSTGPAFSLVSASCATEWLGNPRLGWNFIVAAQPDTKAPLMAHLEQHPVPEGDFEVGHRRFSMFAHDWRAMPASAFSAIMTDRELATTTSSNAPAPPSPATTLAPVVVLSRPEFDQAVRALLRSYHRPDLLRANPLMRSRVAVTRAQGGAVCAATLQSLATEAIERLRASPHDERLYMALAATYVRPAATQELAAERLGLPFGTYRHHLAQGTARAADWLWDRELGLDD